MTTPDMTGTREGSDGLLDPGVLLDPTSERSPELRPRVAPPTSLEGRTVGLMSISKERSDEFLDHIARLLEGRGVRIARFRKPTHTRPAPEAIVQEVVGGCDVVVEALAD